jgi:hypothetical protein
MKLRPVVLITRWEVDMKREMTENKRLTVRVLIVYPALAAAFLALFPVFANASTWVPFQNRYARGSGAPVTVTDTFNLLNPATQYTLKAFNGDLQNSSTELVSSSVVYLNGVQVLGPNNFSQNVTEVDVPVFPQISNTLSVQVRGQPGGVLTIQIVGVDNDPPIITTTPSVPPNAAGWYNSPVTVSFNCSDKTSGVASCPAPVTVSTQGANQVVSGTATDLAGNTAPTSLTVNLDTTPPTITATINPPSDAAGYNNGPVTVTFACSDALSGVASCPPPVTLTAAGANQIVNGIAVDIAGNARSINITVNISFTYFLVLNYGGKCLDYGMSPVGDGATVFLNDCSKANPIRVEEADNNHHVILHAGSQVIGIHNPLAINPGVAINPGGQPPAPAQYTLELQNAANPITVGYLNQLFALDGDSIILASSMPEPQTTPKPVLVAQVLYNNATGWEYAQLVVAPRNLGDSEFWDFSATDGTGRYPTSGFVQVANRQDFLNAIAAVNNVAQSNGGVAWGSVIQVIDSGTPIDFGGQVATICAPAAYTCEIDGTVHNILIPTGVTIRGGRRGVNPGPLLTGKAGYDCLSSGSCGAFPISLFQITGDYARVTGLQLQGPSDCVADPIGCETATEADAHAIQIGWTDAQITVNPNACGMPTNPTCPEPTGVIVDHDDIFDWPEAVQISDNHLDVYYAPCDAQPDLTLNDRAHVDRNFIHHNEDSTMYASGYGIVHGDGGTSTVLGNTFLMNRHSIAGTGERHEQYLAWGNLVLSNVPVYGGLVNQDFDMHGTATHSGGYAGSEVDILWNTFLDAPGTVSAAGQAGQRQPGRPGFALRGKPCYCLDGTCQPGYGQNYVDQFSYNVTMSQTPVNLVDWDPTFTPPNGLPVPYNGPVPASEPYLTMSGNQYVPTNPANRLRVGDFDGDGADDLFLATGAAWYYSPHGKAEWRYLNSGKTDQIDSLLLGDFDGDGRTDVVGINPSGQLVISWGGSSDWVVFNTNFLPCTSISDMAVGDFDGDGKADIFCADGNTWWISYGGNSPFVQAVVQDNTRTYNLRFGDFDGDGTTDVFGVVNGRFSTPQWQVRYGIKNNRVGLTAWQPLPVSLTNTVDDLVVADFDGDGRADVAENLDLTLIGGWAISFNGAGGWASFLITANSPECKNSSVGTLPPPGTGHFAGNKGVDFLFWGAYLFGNPTNNLCIAQGGNQPGQVGWTAGVSLYSLQDMR